MRYAHTNLIARDWARLAGFYERVFGCAPVPPARDQSGAWLERGTGVPGAALRGVHLRLPGHGPRGPTLEIYTYDAVLDRPEPAANRAGLGHLAFEVDDVAATLAALLAEGGAALGEVVSRDVAGVGRLTFTYARDPEGNLIELQRWETAGPDPRRDGGVEAASPRTGMVGAESTRSPSPADVRGAYDRWAERYDADENPTRDADAVVLRARLPALEGRDVLELGCGTGKNTVALAATARSVTAVDFAEQMLAQARAKLATHRAANVRFVQHDLRAPLPFPDASFDVVAVDLVLEHLPALAPVFAQIARVLRPGGEALVVELHPYRQLAGKQANFTDATGARVVVAATVHPVSEFLAATRAAGLAVLELGEWGDDGAATPAVPGAAPRLLSLHLRRA